MRAGQLRHLVTIKSPTHTSDDMGGITTTWGTVTVCWGSLKPLRGREWIESSMENSEIDVRFGMRYYAGITSVMQLYFGSRTFEIVEVINLEERNQELELMLKELVIA